MIGFGMAADGPTNKYAPGAQNSGAQHSTGRKLRFGKLTHQQKHVQHTFICINMYYMTNDFIS